jgi:hypothetical protein
MENRSTDLYSYFGCNFVSNGSTSFYGNVISVFGQPGSIAEGKTYGYLYQQGPDHYVDAISSNGGTIFFNDQTDTGRAVSYSGPTNSYRAIHSTIIFGALQESLNTRNELMGSYMEYLTGLTGIKDEPKPINLVANNFTIFPNPFVAATNIRWNNPLPSKTDIKIYDQSGRLVRWLLKAQSISKGSAVGWDGKDNNGKAINPGIYFVQVSTGVTIITKTIIKTE